jgi:triosephosphate isomerase
MTTPPRARKHFVGGNWKMYTNRAKARELARAVVEGVGQEDRVLVALCPPFPYLTTVAEVLAGSPVVLAGQNCYPENEGAFTGEVSPTMLVDVGCRAIILGHSERRHILGETDAFINRKVHAALKVGLVVCLCLGETLAEREAGHTEAVLEKHLTGSLAGLDAAALETVVLAYEPVWAIGTGKVATPEQVQAVHHFIRTWLRARFGEEPADRLPIAYGGSVKPNNAPELLRQTDVGGTLIGGASLEASQFLAIYKAALAALEAR